VIVVADTSVPCYLALLDCLDLLPRRFGAIAIPSEVADECVQPGAPDELRSFIGNPPDWVRIMDAPLMPDGAFAPSGTFGSCQWPATEQAFGTGCTPRPALELIDSDRARSVTRASVVMERQEAGKDQYRPRLVNSRPPAGASAWAANPPRSGSNG
jgi:hypothetical protein